MSLVLMIKNQLSEAVTHNSDSYVGHVLLLLQHLENKFRDRKKTTHTNSNNRNLNILL